MKFLKKKKGSSRSGGSTILYLLFSMYVSVFGCRYDGLEMEKGSCVNYTLYSTFVGIIIMLRESALFKGKAGRAGQGGRKER